MVRARHAVSLVLLSLALSTTITPAQLVDSPAYLLQALASTARPPQHMARDAEVRPQDALAFARIAPGQIVADLVPGDGYYTRIISKVVGTASRVYAFIPQRGYPNIQQQRLAEQKLRQAGGNPPANALDEVLPLQHASDYRDSDPGQPDGLWRQFRCARGFA